MLVISTFAASSTQYTKIVNEHDSQSSRNIIQAADKLASSGKKDDALVLYTMVCNRFSYNITEQEKEACVLAHLKAATIYYDRGNYINALELEVKGVKISEQCQKQTYTARLYNNIGNVYCVFLDYEKGISYYRKALGLCNKYNDKEMKSKILANLTGMYTYLGKIGEAKKFYKAYEKARDKHDKVSTFMSSYMKGLIERSCGNYRQADRFRHLAAFAKDKKLEPKYECFAYQELYNTFKATNQRDSVIKYLQMCRQASCKHNIQHHFPEVLLELSNIYEKDGNTGKANQYKAMYLNLQDSIFNTRRFDAAKNAQFMYEMNKTTKEIEEMHEKERQRIKTIRNQWIALGISMLFLSVIIVFLIIVHRQKKNLNASYHNLYRQNRDNINLQKKYEALYKQNKIELAEKENEIETLRRAIEEKADSQEATNELKAINTKQEKYHTSNLNEEKQKDIARKIEDIMENTLKFCSKDFSLDTLAEAVGSNSKYVSQVINDTFHMNFNSYINAYRIKLACERLIDVEHYGNLTIKGISESIGFKSHTTFVNVFKKIVGITPSMYQNMAKDDSDNTHKGDK